MADEDVGKDRRGAQWAQIPSFNMQFTGKRIESFRKRNVTFQAEEALFSPGHVHCAALLTLTSWTEELLATACASG